MTYSDIALIAAFVIMAWAVVDWRRGKTGLLRMRLTKDETPQKYWYAIVLYINMAIVLLWLSGTVSGPEPQCGSPDNPCKIVVEGEIA